MAHKKGAGSSKNGRDSNSCNLGIKLSNHSFATVGNIIIRQRGLSVKPGLNVGCGKDFTLYALSDGLVEYSNLNKNTKYISIIK
jgi:large subunit ribosomal protein L27